MRIIAGTHRRRLLLRVEDPNTRETADRIREAIFNMLGSIHGSSVLDLFAGSGAMGLEALSRGARHAVLNDSAKKAFNTIQKNCINLSLTSQTTLTMLDYSEAIQRYQRLSLSFDLIFLDPPYAIKNIDFVLELLQSHEVLSPHAIIVVETAKETILPEQIQTVHKRKETIYGTKKITIYDANMIIEEENHD